MHAEIADQEGFWKRKQTSFSRVGFSKTETGAESLGERARATFLGQNDVTLYRDRGSTEELLHRILDQQARQTEAVEAVEKQVREHTAELHALESRLEAKLLAVQSQGEGACKSAAPDTAKLSGPATVCGFTGGGSANGEALEARKFGASSNAAFNAAYSSPEICAKPAAARIKPQAVSTFRLSRQSSSAHSSHLTNYKLSGRPSASLSKTAMLEEYVASMQQLDLSDAHLRPSPVPD